MSPSNIEFEIREGTIAAAVALSHAIPEFNDPHPEEEYNRRIQDSPFLCLLAYKDSQAVGFKVGYAKGAYFYSWMGGVLPAFRRYGIAKALMEEQHAWAKAKGYPGVEFKTRNGLKPMLIFGIKAGFDIIELDRREEVAEHRILLRKTF